ncbi:MAG: 1-(5-phosphoribosyl)-5-amino-4-imidazole-carboxylate carboxylase, partial [Firmicutes bacterium]|nr:1-(5-phosphoribosyl)-5-amino-4-imidazole-carboxylate carboxylase [Bacillota bacterium]
MKLLDMDKQGIADLLQKVKEREITVDEAMEALRRLPYEDLGFAKIDHHRQLQKGFPEVIY